MQRSTVLTLLVAAALGVAWPAGVATRAPAASAPVRIVLVGDSTVTDDSGWGLGFKQMLAPAATVVNVAANGRSSKSFIDEGRWADALARHGDYYLIQFGHNDEPGKGPERETAPGTTYRANLERYADDVRRQGGVPILVTSLVRRLFEPGTNRIRTTQTPYVEAARAVAADRQVPLIDLFVRSREVVSRMGAEALVPYSARQADGSVDTTHLNAAGSLLFGRLVAEDLARVVPELAAVVRTTPRDAGGIPIEHAPDPVATASRVLDIYWIDVEGGASTLVVTADGRSLLMDTGYDGFANRDPDRIEAVVRDQAGLDRIDYVFTSHFHADHVGGLAELARRIAVGQFVDHGDSSERETEAGKATWDTYLATVGDRRHVARPGERLSLGGVDVVVVAADGRVLPAALAATDANPLCADYEPHPEDTGENGRSLAYVLRAGDFSFVNLGDLSWNFQAQLACPADLIGRADIFQVTHHGTRDDVVPAQMWAIAPTVAVSNNGPTKGAGAEAVETVLASPGLQRYWALHRAVNNDEAHNAAEPYTANLGGIEDCPGAWIRARLLSDGTYTLTNGRNGVSETYAVR